MCGTFDPCNRNHTLNYVYKYSHQCHSIHMSDGTFSAVWDIKQQFDNIIIGYNTILQDTTSDLEFYCNLIIIHSSQDSTM